MRREEKDTLSLEMRMITVQELLNQGSSRSVSSSQQPSDSEPPVSEPPVSEASFTNTSQTIHESQNSESSAALRPFAARRRWMRGRQGLGGVSLVLGYICLGWTLQVSQAPPLVWVAIWAIASVWGLRRSRNWHGLLPAMISALALVGVMLPTWVMGLLLLPMIAFFGCVVLMKGQTFVTAFLSSLAVYSLTVTAASLGAIALSLMGTEFTAVIAHLGRIVAAFLLLSLFPWLHHRRQAPTQQKLFGQRSLVKAGINQGQFAALAAAGLGIGVWLSRMDWAATLAVVNQTL